MSIMTRLLATTGTLSAQPLVLPATVVLQEGKAIFPTAVTDPRVLHCLAEHLLIHEPKSAHALHLTCRAAASAVQQAVSKLSVVGQPVDIVHAVEAFSGLTQLRCTQCALTCQVCLFHLLPIPPSGLAVQQAVTGGSWLHGTMQHPPWIHPDRHFCTSSNLFIAVHKRRTHPHRVVYGSAVAGEWQVTAVHALVSHGTHIQYLPFVLATTQHALQRSHGQR